MKLSRRRTVKPSLGGMLATRQGALILAVVCAAAAAGVLMFALSHYKANVQKTTEIQQATALVATGEIKKGTAGNLIASEKLYTSTPIVATQLVAGAISDAAAIAGKVAVADILPGQQLTVADFGTTAGAAAVLAANQRAVSLPADDVRGDLAVLAPGDHVDVYAEWTSKATGGVPVVSLLLANVTVLKTPTGVLSGALPAAATAAATGAPAVAAPAIAALVLAINSSDVGNLTLVSDTGKIWIALRPVNATASVGGVASATSIMAAVIAAGPTASPAGGSSATTPSTGGSSSGTSSSSGPSTTTKNTRTHP